MSQPPIVSVIVPLHDHADVVTEALDSIHCQDYRPIEVLVVDDGSADGGGAAVAGYRPRVELIRQERSGAGCARNRGLAATAGDLVVFLDADDVFAAGCLRRHVAALAHDPRLDGVYGDVAEFRTDPAPWCGQPRPARHPGSMMLRRRALSPETLFDPILLQVEVIEWVARLDDRGIQLAYVPGLALRRRLHAGNHGNAADMCSYPRQLKAVLDRRRAAGSGRS